MNKNIVVPTALFFLSALLTVMLHPAVLFLAGSVICVIAEPLAKVALREGFFAAGGKGGGGGRPFLA